MNTEPTNTPSDSSGQNAPARGGGRNLFLLLLAVLALEAAGYGLALYYLLPHHPVRASVLAMILFASALPAAAIGWVFLRSLRSAKEISRAAGHVAGTSLANLSQACEALGTGNFDRPLPQPATVQFPVRNGGELGEITAHFNELQRAVAATSATFETARASLHESYQALWENNDALIAELAARKETEESLVKTRDQSDAAAGASAKKLDTLNERLENELAQHKRTENALQGWGQVFEKAGTGMATLHATNDTLLSVNPAFAAMHGYHVNELTGQSLERLVAPEAQADLPAHAAATAKRKNYACEILHIRRDGTKFPVAVNATAVTDADGAVLYRAANFQDITERKAAELSLKTTKEGAEKALRDNSEFLARLSHELRSPLNVMLGFGQLLEMNLADTEHGESAEHLVKAGKQLLALINEALDISRIDADKVSLSLQAVPVGEAMLSAMALVRPMAAQRGIEFVDQLNTRGAKYVMADNERLQQVFHNLLSNAVKYNKQGGRITAWCAERAGNKLAVSVTDTGSGIPAEKLSQLFTPFERLGAEEEGIEGSGLGLALSKRLVELMDGLLEVSSIPGEGSTFSVVLPMASGPVQKLERLADERLTSRERSALAATSRVLYIEADISNVRLVEKLLKPYHKIGLLYAQDTAQGLEMAQQQTPDLILLDLDFPDKAGEEVLQKLRALPATAQVPIVAISADTMPRRIEQMLKLGATQYLTKPIDVNKLLVVIGASINIRDNITA